MRLILNEGEIVRKALSEGYIDEKKPSKILNVLTKYYFGIGMDKKQVRSSLEEFMKKNFKDFNSVKWQDSLDGIVYRSEKKSFELFDVKNVCISKSELHTISLIKNIRLEKLAFVYLVYSKIFNQKNKNDSYWVNAKSKDIFSDCKMAVSSKKQQLMIGELCNLGLLKSSVVVDCTNDKVLFADERSEVEIIISDFRNYIYEYLRWKGEKIINCEGCDVLIKQTNNKMKYCKSCYKNVNGIEAKNRMRKYREKM